MDVILWYHPVFVYYIITLLLLSAMQLDTT